MTSPAPSVCFADWRLSTTALLAGLAVFTLGLAGRRVTAARPNRASRSRLSDPDDKRCRPRHITDDHESGGRTATGLNRRGGSITRRYVPAALHGSSEVLVRGEVVQMGTKVVPPVPVELVYELPIPVDEVIHMATIWPDTDSSVQRGGA